MAEQIIDYQISADVEAVKRALREVDAASERLGRSIGNALSKGGADGVRDLGSNVDRGVRDIEGRSSRTANTVGTALGRGLALGIIAATASGLSGLLTELKEVGDLAKKTGLAVERIGAIKNVGFLEGVAGSDITKGLSELGDKANKQFREGEGDLKELLEANNLKLTDREGKLKSANALLGDAAKLVANANTEFDKIDIARVFGLSEDWVKVLEKGPEALRASITAAEEAGNTISAELVRKAEDFDKAWREAWNSFLLNAKSILSDVGGAISALIGQAQALGSALRSAQAGTLNTQLTTVETKLRDTGLSPLQRKGLEGQRNELVAKRSALQGIDQLQNDAVPFIPLPAAAAKAVAEARKNGTVIPGKDKGGGGGGGGKSDEDKAEDRLERYTDALKRQGDVLAAEIETFGKSNAERKAAIELAKAKTDLDKLDEDTKARLTEGIKAAVSANEAYRESLDRLKGAQEAARSTAQSLADAIGDIVIDGGKAQDVLKNLLKSFARQALNASLAGSGPFAGLFGTKDNSGLFGSLLKPLFSGFPGFASGGELPRGYSMVGENGPELLRNSGSGIARVYPSGQGGSGSGSGGTVVINADFRGAESGAVVQIKNKLDQMEKNFGRMVASSTRQQNVRGYA